MAIVTVSSSIEATAFSRFGPDPPPFQTRATSVEGSLWNGMYAPYPLIPTLSLLFITCNYCRIYPSHAVDKEVVKVRSQQRLLSKSRRNPKVRYTCRYHP